MVAKSERGAIKTTELDVAVSRVAYGARTLSLFAVTVAVTQQGVLRGVQVRRWCRHSGRQWSAGQGTLRAVSGLTGG